LGFGIWDLGLSPESIAEIQAGLMNHSECLERTCDDNRELRVVDSEAMMIGEHRDTSAQADTG
jgi:hypothetical protein